MKHAYEIKIFKKEQFTLKINNNKEIFFLFDSSPLSNIYIEREKEKEIFYIKFHQDHLKLSVKYSNFRF